LASVSPVTASKRAWLSALQVAHVPLFDLGHVYIHVRHHQDRSADQIQNMLDQRTGLRTHRVGVANRRDWQADLHGRKLDQSHSDAVFGQDGHRAVSGQAHCHQPVAQSIDSRQGFGVGQAMPLILCIAFLQEGFVGESRRILV
jgi:hypothetical protein